MTGLTDRALYELIEVRARELGVPGASLAVLSEGKEQRVTWGVTSVENPLPVTDETLFQIGSITKIFTAAAVASFLDDVERDLESPVRRFLPDLQLQDADVAEAVTLRDLLTHYAGWRGDFFEDTGSGDDALARLVARMVELEQITPLGVEFSYCNSAYSLLGRVIEVVSGKSYEQVIRERLIAPLGLRLTAFGAASAITHRTSVGHVVNDGQPLVARPWEIPRAANPLGGLVSTIDDMVKVARWQLHSQDGPLAPDLIRIMQLPQRAAGSIGDSVGLAWFQRRLIGADLLQHTGGMNGQVCGLYLCPERDFALIVLSNADWGNQLLESICDEVFRAYLQAGAPPRRAVIASPSALAEYAGEFNATHWLWRLSLVEDTLMIEPRPVEQWLAEQDPPLTQVAPAEVVLYAPDQLVVTGPGRTYNMMGEFGRGADGGISWLRFDGRISPKA